MIIRINAFFTILFFSIILFSNTSKAQSITEQSDSSTFLSSAVKLSGEVGVTGELYSISGKEKRRPSSSGLIFFRPSLTFFNNFNVAFDILLSTEGSSARQEINQFALHPDWGWGKAHIGDFTHDFSQLTLSGLTIRGGGVEINPGIFRLQIIGGQTQRAVKSGAYSSMYSRYLTGVKLGLGKEESSYFDINVVRVRDNTASLSRDIFYTDSTKTTREGITPQENLVVGANTQISFLDDMFRFSGEIAGDVFTSDMYSPTYKLDKLPEIARKIYSARISSSVDYAYNTELNFKYNNWNAGVSYMRINPGYTSLGLASLVNDKERIGFSAGVRLLENKLILQTQFNTQSDNLLSQKKNTLTRNAFSLSANIIPIKELSIVLNSTINTMTNDDTSSIAKIDNINSLYSINIISQLQFFNMNHSINASYSTQTAKDNNTMRKGTDVTVQNIMLGLTTLLNQYWTVAPNVMFNIMDIEQKSSSTTTTFNFRVQNRMFNGKFQNSVNVGLNNSDMMSAVTLTYQSGYSITSSDAVSIIFRSAFNRGKGSYIERFDEHKANLNFTHRF